MTNLAYSRADFAESKSLSWNSKYQLKEVLITNHTNQIQYSYDVLGRKVSRTAGILPADAEQYAYNGNQVAADLYGSGKLIRTYTWGPGKRGARDP